MHFAFVEQQLHNPDAEARERWLTLIGDDKLFGQRLTGTSRTRSARG